MEKFSRNLREKRGRKMRKGKKNGGRGSGDGKGEVGNHELKIISWAIGNGEVGVH